MPFKSEKQRRYMHANLPEIAQRWERDYASGGIARLGYQQGNWVAPFYNTNVMQGSVIPPDMGTYNYQHPRGTDIIGMDEMNTYGQLPMGTDTIGMNEMFSYPKIKPDYNFGRDIDQTYREGDFNVNPKQPAWYNRMFNKAGQGITGLKNQMGNIFSGARNKGGALMGNILGMAAGIPGLGTLLGNIRPDNPYEKFQKQMFAEMGYQGDPNKDPFGKNVRSLFGNYDVRDQFDKLARSKLGEKYGYEAAMADGVLTDEELEAMQEKGLKGWQLNRFKTLFEAKKRAKDWRAKQEETTKNKRDANLITSKMTHDGGDGKTYTTTKKHHGDVAHEPGGRFDVSHKSSSTPQGYSARSHSGGSYGGRYHWAKGGIVSLWPK